MYLDTDEERSMILYLFSFYGEGETLRLLKKWR